MNQEKKDSIKKANIDEIMEEVCINENVTISDITKRAKIQKISDIRKAIVFLSAYHCNVANTILSQKLNLLASMISKIKSGDSKGTTYVAEGIRSWEEISK